jgi:hypothetical protein
LTCKEALAGDPRVESEHEPLILFTAQDTLLVPEDDCPKMIERALSRKAVHDVEVPTWLVLWSNHPAFSSLRDHLDTAIAAYLKSRTVKYERVFHLHLFPNSGATEFPLGSRAENA